MSKTFGNFTDFLDFSRSSGGTALRKVSYGSELVTNGTFDTDLSGWVTTSTNATNTVTWNSGAVDFVSDGSTSLGLNQYAVFTVGKLYQLKIDVTVNSGNVAGIKVQYTGTDSSIGVITATGSYTFNFIAGGVNLDIYRRTGGSATNVTIDNISVKEVTLDSGSDDPVLFNHPADTPRIEYATDGTVRGLLIEEARTNFVTYSVVDDSPYWDLIGAGTGSTPVRTLNQGIAPDGTQTAAQLQFDLNGGVTSSDRSILSHNSVSGTNGADYTSSVWLKSADGTSYDIHLSISGAAAITVTVTDEWQKFDTSLTYSTFTMQTRIGLQGNQNTSDTANILIWGAQLERGSFATSYIPTSGATATRSADIASIAVENFGYSQDEGTMYIEFEAYSWALTSDTITYNRVWEFYGNMGSNADGIYRSANEGDGTLLRYRFNENDSVTPAIGAANLGSVTGVHKVAVALGQDDAAIVMDGGTPATGSGTAAMDTYQDVYLGRHSANHSYLNGHIRDFQYYPRRLTNRQLQEVTGATNTYDYTTVEAGTITRSPVATGSDLVAYSGFSSTNYFEQPYNPDLDFGTGDFCVMGWSNQPASGAFRYLISRDSVVSAERFFIAVNTGSEVRGIINDNITPTVLQGSAKFDGTWKYVAMIRKSGTAYLYVNGVLQASSASTQNITNTSAKLFLGVFANPDSSISTSGSLALWRISATAPTAEQIAKIYEDEKVLFQQNAQATLYGSSDAVTALAHDDVTNLLHVGTSAGRSVFQGLRRVENTTDAVGTAISANNGLVVEE